MPDLIMVTGATGKVGGKLLALLAEQGIPVRATVRTPEQVAKLQRPGVETALIDGSAACWRTAFEGVGKAFIMTPLVPDQGAFARPIVEAAASAGVRHIVRLSVIGAENGDIALQRQHRATETQIEETGIPFTFLRPNSFMQNLFKYTPTIKTQNVFYQPTGSSRVSYVDSRDVSAVAAKVLTTPGHEGKAYTITGGEALSHAEIAGLMSEVTGKPVSFVSVPDEAFRKNMVTAGIPPWLIETLMELMWLQSSGKSEHVHSTVSDILGRQPASMRDFVKENTEVWK